MITIVYASRAVAPLDELGLAGLLADARTRNAAHDVTGMLLYAYESFMQQLEGPQEAVDGIYASIVEDRRHTDLRLFSRREVSERRFGDWAMGSDHPDADALAARLPGYRPTVAYPLVDAQLVVDSTAAEAVLALAAADASAGSG